MMVLHFTNVHILPSKFTRSRHHLRPPSVWQEWQATAARTCGLAIHIKSTPSESMGSSAMFAVSMQVRHGGATTRAYQAAQRDVTAPLHQRRHVHGRANSRLLAQHHWREAVSRLFGMLKNLQTVTPRLSNNFAPCVALTRSLVRPTEVARGALSFALSSAIALQVQSQLPARH
jgi:hypothetical protein